MNILHIWDQSGVACVLAKYQQKMGHSVKVMRRSNYDPYGIYKFYNNLVEFSDEKNYLDSCLKEANNADIVHIHSRMDALFYLRKKLGLKKKIVIHFHGSDLRGIKQKNIDTYFIKFPKTLFENYRANIIRKKNNLLAGQTADIVILATPDLKDQIIKANPIVVNNPVDTEHFSKSTESRTHSNETFFTFSTEATSSTRWIINYCKKNGIKNLQVIDRTKYPIPYSDMPRFLQEFSTYVDVRYVNDKILHNLSKTALESLASGLKVINYELKYKFNLPEEHEPTNVTNKIESIYQEIL